MRSYRHPNAAHLAALDLHPLVQATGHSRAGRLCSENGIHYAGADEIAPGAAINCGFKTERFTTLRASAAQLRQGCLGEIAKIEILQRELELGLAEMQSDLQAVQTGISTLESTIRGIDSDLQKRLKAQAERGQGEITELVAARQRWEAANETGLQLIDFEKRLGEIARDLAAPAPKPKAARATQNSDGEHAFCEEVRRTLERWKFPKAGAVRLDHEKFDLVIADQSRGSFGKGYRAFTHAAFTIALMRHCRSRGIPHPGFVLLDTPLNPLRGPDEAPEMKMQDPMKRAFFEDLVSDKSGDQFIIFENSEPPTDLRANMSYLHFSHNVSVGRHGFFPAAK